MNDAIEIDEYEPNPDKPEYQRRVRRKTVREVYDLLRAELEKREMIDEYFHAWPPVQYANRLDTPFPEGRFIACYAVTGGSEGHYVHVEVVQSLSDDCHGESSRSTTVFLGKTFQGWDHAWEMAKVCAECLGA